VAKWPIATLRAAQQFGRFRSEADTDAHRSEFMGTRPKGNRDPAPAV
jgi:hypothetical protein